MLLKEKKKKCLVYKKYSSSPKSTSPHHPFTPPSTLNYHLALSPPNINIVVEPAGLLIAGQDTIRISHERGEGDLAVDIEGGIATARAPHSDGKVIVLGVAAVVRALQRQRRRRLVRLAGEVVVGLDGSCDAWVGGEKARVVGVEDGEGEARRVLEGDVELAVFARVGEFGVAAYAGGEFGAEV